MLYTGTWLAYGLLLSYTWIRAESVHVRIRRQQKTCTGDDTFQCDNTKCISKYAVCDGTPQCRDLMDESPTVCREVSKNCIIPRQAEGTSYNVGDCARSPGICGGVSTGKTVTVSCKTGYVIPFTINETTIVACPSSNWDHHMTKCARCGRAARNGSPAQGRFDTTVDKYPWHVSIYKKFSGNFFLTCGGSLITPHLVITAANCVYNADGKTPIPSEYKIIAGKAHYQTSQQDKIQEREVEKILFRKTFNGDINSYTQNIALMKVEKDFNINGHVNVICVHDQVYLLCAANCPVSVSGWGLSKDKSFNKLKEASYQTTDIKKCRKLSTSVSFDRFFSYDKFCVLFNTGANGLQPVDSGNGIVLSVGGTNYLYGIVSARVAVNDKFSIVTNITKHLDWVKKSIHQISSRHVCSNSSFHCDTGSCISKDLICNGLDNCGDGSDEKASLCPDRAKPNSSGTCVLPEYGKSNIFRQQTCVSDLCNLKPGSVIPKGTVVKMACQKGYAFSELKQHENPSACLNGVFYPTLPKCTKLCDPLQSISLQIQCSYKGENISCSKMMLPNTKADYSCLFQYKPLDPSTFNGNNLCQEGGLWKKRLPSCISKCGTKSDNSGIPTISFGTPAKEGGYPWHVGLYRKRNNTFEQACGGSLVSPYIVVTAAHCVYRETTHTKWPESEYLIAAGKYYRDLSVQEPHMQILNVKTIMIKEGYYGAATFYADDIALVVVERSFELNKFVLPVCVDRSQQQIPVNAIGTTVGWGFTEGNKSSHELLVAHMPYLDLNSCRRTYVASGFVSFLTSDKFCVKYINGTGTQVGDSGGGYTHEVDRLHYLFGVTSLKSRESNEFGVFTSIAAHLSWLTTTMANIESNSELK